MNYVKFFLGIILFSSAVVNAQSINNFSNSTETKKIDTLIRSLHEMKKFNGAILVSKDGNIIYKNAIGMANKRMSEELKIESSFYLASVSKPFTAMAIMILKERNELTYEDSLSKYFPEFPSYADNITIKHLLTHTSGIPDHFRLNSYKIDLNNSDVLEILLKQTKTEFKPGDKFSYSNSGYVLLAMIIEKVSKIPFHEFMYQNIFSPVGMKNTLVFDDSKPEIANRVMGHNEIGLQDDYKILTAGAGGIFSTVEDLHSWSQALDSDKLVSRETMDEAFSLVVLNDESISNYGYGWFIDQDKNTVSHAGAFSGFRTLIKKDFNNNRCFIILTNYGGSLSFSAIENQLDEALKSTDLVKPARILAGKNSIRDE